MDLYRSVLARRSFYSCTVLLNKEAPNNIKNKKPSSQRWLVRQLRDPYVEKAKQENYRCRSAFKLLEMNERCNLLTPGMTVIDCGAAPGSWTQVAARLTNSSGKNEDEAKGSVFAIDKQPIHPIEGATILGNMDFTKLDSQNLIRDLLNGLPVDLVMSDMAPNASGVREIDHELIIDLAYCALKFSLQILKKDGNFLTKVWDGGKSLQLEKDIERFYKKVKILKPGATRDESTEKFILARGFKGLKK